MSRLLAATLMRSSRLTGMRSEIDVVVGFRFAKRARVALLQSTWSSLSCVSQNLRSSASLANCGSALVFLLIPVPLLAGHVARGDHAKARALRAQCEGQVQQAPDIRLAESVKPRLTIAVADVLAHQKRCVEERLLRFALRDAMFLDALACVAFITFEALHALEVHRVYITGIYIMTKRVVTHAFSELARAGD